MGKRAALGCLLLAILFIVGCDIPASERCGEGDKFEWNPESRKCKLRDTDTSDGGTGDSGTDGDLPSGLGEPCTKQEECEGFEANHCNARDVRPNGYCSIKDCQPGECPAEYQCCDCTVPGFGISCVSEIDVSAAENIMSCVCD